MAAIKEDREEVIYHTPKPTMHTLDHQDMIKEFSINTVIHGDCTIPALDKMERGNLFRYVRHGWHMMGLEVGTRLQRCAWPQIIRGHDSFIVGLKGSGKTLSYLSPICAMILSNVIEWNQLKGTGPVAIIFTRNNYSSLKIEHLAQMLLQSCGNNLIYCQAITNFKAKTWKLCSNGVEVIVTTPELFLDKADKTEWLQFSRLKFFVIDDAHYHLRSKNNVINSLFKKYKTAFVNSSSPPQIIVCGSEWSSEVESLYWTMPRKPTVIIGSLKAAIPYSRIKCQVHYVEPAYKLTTLISNRIFFNALLSRGAYFIG